jgi:hypothetical protein
MNNMKAATTPARSSSAADPASIPKLSSKSCVILEDFCGLESLERCGLLQRAEPPSISSVTDSVNGTDSKESALSPLARAFLPSLLGFFAFFVFFASIAMRLRGPTRVLSAWVRLSFPHLRTPRKMTHPPPLAKSLGKSNDGPRGPRGCRTRPMRLSSAEVWSWLGVPGGSRRKDSWCVPP